MDNDKKGNRSSTYTHSILERLTIDWLNFKEIQENWRTLTSNDSLEKSNNSS